MIKNLYVPQQPKKEKIEYLNPTLMHFNCIQYSPARLKVLAKTSSFKNILSFNKYDELSSIDGPIIAIWEHLGETTNFLTDIYNNLKLTYPKNPIYLIIDDMYEGLLTQKVVDNLQKQLKLDGVAIVTSNYKLKGNNIFYINYHLYSAEFDNIDVGQFKFAFNTRLRNKKFICLNRQERLHRLLTIDYLIEKDYLKHTHASCSNKEYKYITKNADTYINDMPLSEFAEDRLYTSFDEVKNYHFSAEQQQRLDTNLPVKLENESFLLNPRVLPRADDYFYDSYWALCTERDFYKNDLYEGFTEKTVKCLLYGLPFIIIGLPNTLSKLRDLGFITFSNVIDESYDTIQNNDKRFAAIKEQIDYLASLNYNELNLLNLELQPILEYNYKRFMQIHNSMPNVNFVNRLQSWLRNYHQSQ